MSESNEIKKTDFDKVDNSALVKAMSEAREKKSGEAELEVISELKKARFISPALVDDKSPKGGAHIQFMMIKDQDGKRFLPAFTSKKELLKYRSEAAIQTVVCTLKQYVDLLTSREDGPCALVVDPFGANVLLTKDFLERLKDEMDDTKLKVVDFNEHPEEIENCLKEFFDEEGTIEKAYIQLMKRGEVVSILLIVDNKYPDNASDEEIGTLRKDLFDRIADRIQPEFKKYKSDNPVYSGLQFSLTDLNLSLGKEIAEGRTAFYTRG